MKMTIDHIEAGKLLLESELERLGLSPECVVRVVVETVDDRDDISVTEMNARGEAFAHLAEEPELYTDSDLVERNEAFLR